MFSALKPVMLLQFAHILTSVKREGNSKRSYKKPDSIPFRAERNISGAINGRCLNLRAFGRVELWL